MIPHANFFSHLPGDFLDKINRKLIYYILTVTKHSMSQCLQCPVKFCGSSLYAALMFTALADKEFVACLVSK